MALVNSLKITYITEVEGGSSLLLQDMVSLQNGYLSSGSTMSACGVNLFRIMLQAIGTNILEESLLGALFQSFSSWQV